MDNFFSKNVKSLRIRNNITQEQLGKLLGKDYSTVGKWEKGTHYPVLDDAYKLSLIFGMTIEDLIGKDLTDSNLLNSILDDTQMINKYRLLSENDKELVNSLITTRIQQNKNN